jgi:hypothetical protein
MNKKCKVYQPQPGDDKLLEDNSVLTIHKIMDRWGVTRRAVTGRVRAGTMPAPVKRIGGVAIFCAKEILEHESRLRDAHAARQKASDDLLALKRHKHAQREANREAARNAARKEANAKRQRAKKEMADREAARVKVITDREQARLDLAKHNDDLARAAFQSAVRRNAERNRAAVEYIEQARQRALDVQAKAKREVNQGNLNRAA